MSTLPSNDDTLLETYVNDAFKKGFREIKVHLLRLGHDIDEVNRVLDVKRKALYNRLWDTAEQHREQILGKLRSLKRKELSEQETQRVQEETEALFEGIQGDALKALAAKDGELLSALFEYGIAYVVFEGARTLEEAPYEELRSISREAEKIAHRDYPEISEAARVFWVTRLSRARSEAVENVKRQMQEEDSSEDAPSDRRGKSAFRKLEGVPKAASSKVAEDIKGVLACFGAVDVMGQSAAKLEDRQRWKQGATPENENLLRAFFAAWKTAVWASFLQLRTEEPLHGLREGIEAWKEAYGAGRRSNPSSLRNRRRSR